MGTSVKIKRYFKIKRKQKIPHMLLMGEKIEKLISVSEVMIEKKNDAAGQITIEFVEHIPSVEASSTG